MGVNNMVDDVKMRYVDGKCRGSGASSCSDSGSSTGSSTG